MHKSKNRNFTTFLFPLGTPLGQSRWNGWMLDGWKENAMLAACANLSITISEIIQRYICEKIVIFIIPPLHSTPPLGGFPSEYDYRHDGTPFGMEKLEWCRQSHIRLWVSLSDGEKISKISFFVLTWSTNVTDRQTDRHCVTAKTALASHRAVKMFLFTASRGSLDYRFQLDYDVG